MVQQENQSINPGKKCCNRNNGSNIDLECRLKYLQAYLKASIEVAKERYYHNKVNKLINSQKEYKVY